jgi:hypothetical protein
MSKKVYNKHVQSFFDYIPSMIEAAKKNSDTLDLIDRMESEFPDSFLSCWRGATLSSFDVNFKFDKFSDAKKVLRFMALNKQKRVGKVQQMADAQQMVWRFEKIKIIGNFKKDGGTCRYVQTGVELVEQPIFELQCEEVFDVNFVETVVEEVLPF